MSATQTINEPKQAEESDIKPVSVPPTPPNATIPVPVETETQPPAINLAQLVPTESIEAVSRLFKWAKATQ